MALDVMTSCVVPPCATLCRVALRRIVLCGVVLGGCPGYFHLKTSKQHEVAAALLPNEAEVFGTEEVEGAEGADSLRLRLSLVRGLLRARREVWSNGIDMHPIGSLERVARYDA